MALALHSGLSRGAWSWGRVSRDKSQEGGLGKSGEDGVQGLQSLQCLGRSFWAKGSQGEEDTPARAQEPGPVGGEPGSGTGRQCLPLICCALRFAPSKRQFPAALGRGSHRASSGAHSLSGMGGGRMQVGDLTATQLRCWDPDAEAQAWCGHCELWFFRQSCTDMSVGP